ncbi:MAG: hypothetical protein DRO96_01095 [Candidatus Aenigmatarchaeota archaeon]|nr:MAG: hypothetical protein DRO96_01095 [Candidatus Aenigmarchaeota archaeon]
MEVKIVSKEQIGEPVVSANRAVWLRKYKMDKVKVFRDDSGDVVREIPFRETVFSLFVVGQTLWLNQNLFGSLKEVLAEQEELEDLADEIQLVVNGGDAE